MSEHLSAVQVDGRRERALARLARAVELLRADADSHARLARLHRKRAKELQQQADQLAAGEQTQP